MIIFLEAQDNCGKGTQIANIRNHFYPEKQFHILHYGGVKSSEIPEVQLQYNKIYYNEMFRIISMLHQANMNVILDRSHLGEHVYAPLYRGYDPSYIWDLESMFMGKPWWNETYLIHFTLDVKEQIKRDDGFSHSVDLEMRKKEQDAFLQAFGKSRIHHKMHLDITGLDKDQVFNFVKPFLGIK